MPDITNKIDEINEIISGSEGSHVYVDTTTDVMKKCDEIIDTIKGVEPETPYVYFDNSTDIMVKLGEVVETIKENPGGEEADYLIKSDDGIYLPARINQLPFLSANVNRDFELELEIEKPSDAYERVIFSYTTNNDGRKTFFETKNGQFGIYSINTNPQVRDLNLGPVEDGKVVFSRKNGVCTWSVNGKVLHSEAFTINSAGDDAFYVGGHGTTAVYTGLIKKVKFTWLT